MFIKRAKSRPSIRARDSDIETTGSPLAKSSFTPDDPAEDVEDGGRILERKKAQKKEKRKDELGKTTRLSFGGDDDGGEGEVTPFKPKKSLLSQSLKLPSTPLTSSSAAETPSTLSSVYSREYLCELKASTPSRAPRRPTVEDDEDDDMDRSGLSRLARNKYAPTIVEDTTAGIPDAVAIASAKSKRQAAVENVKHNGNLGEDYIALGGEQIAVYDGTEGPHPESRLMREEDEGEEGDEGM
jgi:GC-rich sequence DNA-binding factor